MKTYKRSFKKFPPAMGAARILVEDEGWWMERQGYSTGYFVTAADAVEFARDGGGRGTVYPYRVEAWDGEDWVLVEAKLEDLLPEMKPDMTRRTLAKGVARILVLDEGEWVECAETLYGEYFATAKAAALFCAAEVGLMWRVEVWDGAKWKRA